MNPYIGHDNQYIGFEEHRLVGGRGDGMRLLEAYNGLGLELTVSLDLAADISRLKYRGINMAYFSPCGYVAPAYYEGTGTNWLKSFTAGFLTTCGLQSVGTACVDEGEEVPMHGSLANFPSENAHWYREDKELVVRAMITDEVLFSRKLRLNREIRISLESNSFRICDVIENTGDTLQPFEILYHMNMGYPLLDEDSVLIIPSKEVISRDAHAEEDIQNWMQIVKPEPGYVERCYYHKFEKEGRASIYQPKLGQGLEISFDAESLDGFVEWKMMGVRDYVLGLECGNCYPDGRDVMRRTGMLKFLEPGSKLEYQVNIRMIDRVGERNI